MKWEKSFHRTDITGEALQLPDTARLRPVQVRDKAAILGRFIGGLQLPLAETGASDSRDRDPRDRGREDVR